MRKLYITILAIILTAMAWGQHKTYFISTEGNDDSSGLSIKEAWKSLSKVNSVVFQAGDKILFESGKTWYGQLKPQGSGAAEAPIQLSSFGGDIRPVINIGNAEGAGIRLTNQSWWEISNMEVTSGAPPVLGIGRQGIVSEVEGDNKHIEHLVVKNCYIHDIWGQLGGNTEYTGYNSCGIFVQLKSRRGMNHIVSSTLDDVLIENNTIERFDKCGIIILGCKNKMVVRGNYMNNLGGDGIFTGGCYRGLIEHNVANRTCQRSGYLDLVGGSSWWPHTAAIWIQDAEETVMQYNEVHDTGRQPGNGDGEAYDFDFYCKRCIAQYNYSQNNHGFLLIMNRTFENIARYNISENDQTHLIQMQCAIEERNLIYNNIFYIDHGTVDLDFFCGNDGLVSKRSLGAIFHNNIFYANGQCFFRTVYASGEVLKRTFDENTKVATGTPQGLFFHNCYFGPWKNGIPDDPEKLEADPKFVSPGSGGYGLQTLQGYQLRSDSPCLNNGLYVSFNGGKDFWGNTVDDGSIDIGAFEQKGSGLVANLNKEKQLDQSAADESAIALAKWIFPLQVSIPEAGSEAEIRLIEPLERGISGQISWKDSKGNKSSLSIDKQKKRDSFTIKVSADKSSLLSTNLHVDLKYKNLQRAWDIPFTAEKFHR